MFEQLVAEVEACFVTASQEKRLTIRLADSEYRPFSRNLILASVPICQYITDAKAVGLPLDELEIIGRDARNIIGDTPTEQIYSQLNVGFRCFGELMNGEE